MRPSSWRCSRRWASESVTVMALKIIRRAAGAECASILAELPDWFGLPDANAAYAEVAEREQAWVADEADQPLGLMILIDPGFAALDIHLIAIRPHAHGRGVGKALIRHACAVARERGKPYLTVKTLGPSARHEPYERTRAFYEAVGFRALEESTAIWGPANPCLLMIMPVSD
jgi:GNAT superfamily N-acetyltransferase